MAWNMENYYAELQYPSVPWMITVYRDPSSACDYRNRATSSEDPGEQDTLSIDGTQDKCPQVPRSQNLTNSDCLHVVCLIRYYWIFYKYSKQLGAMSQPTHV